MQHRELTNGASSRFSSRSLSAALCVVAIVMMSHVCMAPDVFRFYCRHGHRSQRRSRQRDETEAPKHGYQGHPPGDLRPRTGSTTSPICCPVHIRSRLQRPGFKDFLRSNMLLRANTSSTVNIALQVGSATQQVTVSGEAVLLDTETANNSGDHG